MIELAPGIFLLAFQNSEEAKAQLSEEALNETEVLFKGDTSLIMELAPRYVMRVEDGRYRDYFYDSTGFTSPTMSLQTAIWASERSLNKESVLTYFIILKKVKSEVL